MELSEWQNEQIYEPDIVCPWCGYRYTDSWIDADADDDFICESCGKHFEVERDVLYTSRRKGCDMPKDMEGAASGR